MKHQHLERHLRTALDGHGVLLRSTVITREDTTGDWELAAVWGAPSDAALRQLIAEDLDAGHIPDGWGTDRAADDYRNPRSATWRWAQSTASSWDEPYWNAHTRAYVSDLLADAYAHAGIQGRITVLFEQHDPLRIGELLHRHHHSPAPVTI